MWFSHATVDMSGTNGGPGGSGGAAGDGTSGANGGKAAEIRIFIKEEDMDLLLALNPPKVDGGRAGKAGVNGIPGPGGALRIQEDDPENIAYLQNDGEKLN
jgi:hypothetical protein